ncbi:hypothetical protein [Nocardioides sp.]|uniref:hypothetical protein n=1 Tax=Nocardioides sp. TaxID=35761 RepID=UPI00271F94CD|nr:hypothetical protein [Nocardioides sp.]MDO9454934.1 hypothetical protein [Nocardioides sp.]
MSIEQPSRRTLIKAAAWAAPTIVVVTSAPAFAAASNQVYATVSASREGSVVTGTATIFNTTATPVSIQLTAIVFSPSPPWYSAYTAEPSGAWTTVSETISVVDDEEGSTITVTSISITDVPAGGSLPFSQRFQFRGAPTTFEAGTVKFELTPSPSVSVAQPPPASYPGGTDPVPAPPPEKGSDRLLPRPRLIR